MHPSYAGNIEDVVDDEPLLFGFDTRWDMELINVLFSQSVVDPFPVTRGGRQPIGGAHRAPSSLSVIDPVIDPVIDNIARLQPDVGQIPLFFSSRPDNQLKVSLSRISVPPMMG
jgi:hypothetical protein